MRWSACAGLHALVCMRWSACAGLHALVGPPSRRGRGLSSPLSCWHTACCDALVLRRRGRLRAVPRPLAGRRWPDAQVLRTGDVGNVLAGAGSVCVWPSVQIRVSVAGVRVAVCADQGQRGWDALPPELPTLSGRFCPCARRACTEAMSHVECTIERSPSTSWQSEGHIARHATSVPGAAGRRGERRCVLCACVAARLRVGRRGDVDCSACVSSVRARCCLDA